jgi:hypothetical protein
MDIHAPQRNGKKKKNQAAAVMKRILTFVILSCILFDPVAGTFTWLQYKKAIVKQAVREMIDEGMDKSELVLLKFTREETRIKLRWEHEREFEYNHRMYDIVRTMTVGDTVYYWCWYDHIETMLNRQMEELASQAAGQSSKNKKEQAMLAFNSRSLYFPFTIYLDLDIKEDIDKLSVSNLDFYSQISTQPPTPPPQFN